MSTVPALCSALPASSDGGFGMSVCMNQIQTAANLGKMKMLCAQHAFEREAAFSTQRTYIFPASESVSLSPGYMLVIFGP